jgi:hypothetical protein
MLTVTGKPRRDRVRTKFLTEMQTVYSALSIAHSEAREGKGEGEPQSIPSSAALLLSPSPDIVLAPVPSSSMRAAVTDLDLVLPETVLQATAQPSMAVADSAVLVASLSAHWGSRCHTRLAVAVRLPAVLELSCSLQAPFAALVTSLSRTVGPSSVAEVKSHDLPPVLVLRLHYISSCGQSQSSISPSDLSLLIGPSRADSLSVGGATWCRGEKPVSRRTRAAVQAAAGGRGTTWGSASSAPQRETAKS